MATVWIFFDTETSNISLDGKVYSDFPEQEDLNNYLHKIDAPTLLNSNLNPQDLLYIEVYNIGWQVFVFDNGEHTEGFKSSTNIADFVEVLKKYPKATLFGYNIKYDMTALIRQLKVIDPTITMTMALNDKGHFLNGRLKSKKVFNHRLKDLWVWQKSRSLASWITELGLPPKLSIPYCKWYAKWKGDILTYKSHQGIAKSITKEIEDNYLRNDVTPLVNIKYRIKQIKQVCVDLLSVPGYRFCKFHGETLPSFVKYCFSENLTGREYTDLRDMNKSKAFDVLLRPQIPHLYMYTRDSYIGGFCAGALDKNHWRGDNIFCYDVNSMYPYVMTLGLPCGVPTFNKPQGECKTFYVVKWTVLEWNDENKVLSTKPLPFKNEKPFVIYSELFDQVKKMTSEWDVEIIKTFYTEVTHSLTDVIKTLYKFKAECTDEEKELREAAKLMLNSSYGKMAEKAFEMGELWDDNLGTFIPDESDNDLSLQHSNLAGIYITNQARVIMFKGIEAARKLGNEILYCDTDSITMVKNNVISGLEEDPKKLGAWKLEGNPKEFFWFFKCKKYVRWYEEGSKENKIACSGLPKHIIPLLPYELLLIVYNPNNNICIEKAKVISKYNRWGQTILMNVDFHTNPYVKNGHIEEEPTHNLSYYITPGIKGDVVTFELIDNKTKATKTYVRYKEGGIVKDIELEGSEIKEK